MQNHSRRLLTRLGALVLAAIPCRVEATALGDAAAGMAPGTWATLSTNNINPTLNSIGASGIIFGYAQYIEWDPITRRLYYMGSDHNSTNVTLYAEHVQYDEATNTWSRLPEQDFAAAPPGNAQHGYDHGTIDPIHRYFYFRSPSNLTMHRWHIDTQVWSAVSANDVIQYNSCCVGIEYFPELGGVIWVSAENGANGGATLLNDSTGRWQRVGSEAAYPFGGYHNFAEYNPVHHVMLFGGGNDPGSRNIYKIDTNGTITALRDAPVGLGIQQSIVTVDPVSGDYLIVTAAQQLYSYDVVSDTWTLRASGAQVPIWTTRYSDPVHGVVGGAISTYGVNVFVTCDGSDACSVHLYKHVAGVPDKLAPAPPSNLRVR